MLSFFRQWILLGTALTLFLIPINSLAEEWNLEEKPWEKFGANFGVFLSNIDTSFRIGSGLGVDLDVEELLGLDATTSVFRLDALWRFSENRRHRLDFSWFSIKRDATTRIIQDITIGEGSDQITIDSGTDVSSFFDLDIYEIGYSYSFFQDDRIDVAAGIGAYIMPLDFGLKVTGLVAEEGSAKFTAPLPVVGLRMDIALTPKWFIRTGGQVFYIEFDNFTGSLLKVRAAVEYNPWKHVGLGLGFDTLNALIEADGDTDWPGVDLNGKVDFSYTGLQLYVRLFY
jgi:hypothetical protein